jgi:hypothetical protein
MTGMSHQPEEQVVARSQRTTRDVPESLEQREPSQRCETILVL